MLISKDRMNFVVRNCSERVMHLFKHACKTLKIPVISEGTELSSLISLKQLKKIDAVDEG